VIDTDAAETRAEPGASKLDPILVVEGVERRFGGLVAVQVERLEIQRCSITALIGPNGAGKTTLFNVVTGFDRADGGQWRFDGTAMRGWPAYRIARRGMVRTFQLTKALAGMTVLDNMMLGATGQAGERLGYAPLRFRWRAQEQEVHGRAVALLADFGLADRRGDLAGTMSGGQRKLLEMARALMVDPQLVMLDEPMAGVNPALVESLLEHVKRVRDAGHTVVFVEHDMDVVMSISDWVVCMAQGSVIAEGAPGQISSNERVIDAYLGRHHGAPA
jgi:branched-chain amino acid transport system ATP-binding protein